MIRFNMFVDPYKYFTEETVYVPAFSYSLYFGTLQCSLWYLRPLLYRSGKYCICRHICWVKVSTMSFCVIALIFSHSITSTVFG